MTYLWSLNFAEMYGTSTCTGFVAFILPGSPYLHAQLKKSQETTCGSFSLASEGRKVAGQA